MPNLADTKKAVDDFNARLAQYKSEVGEGDAFDISKLSLSPVGYVEGMASKDLTGEAAQQAEDRAKTAALQKAYSEFLQDRQKAIDQHENNVKLETATREFIQAAPIHDAKELGIGGGDQKRSKGWRSGLKALDFAKLQAGGQFKISLPDDAFETHSIKAIFGVINAPGAAVGTGQARPTDRVMEANYPALDFLDRYMVSPIATETLRCMDMVRSTTAAGPHQRTDTGALNEANQTALERTYTIEPQGLWQPLPISIANDNDRFQTFVEMGLEAETWDHIKNQVLAGTGSGGQWAGIAVQTVASAKADENGDARAVASNTKILPYLEQLVVEKYTRGVGVDTVLLSFTDWGKLRAAWEALGFPLLGAFAGPMGFGTIMGADVLPTMGLAANTAVAGAFRTRAEIGIRREAMVETDRSARFENYQLASRCVVEGAVGYWQAQAGTASSFVRMTATNNWVS